MAKKHKMVDNLDTKSKSYTFLNSMECPICTLKDPEDNSMRMLVDKYLVTHSVTQTMTWLKEDHGVSLTKRQVENHIDIHSKFIPEMKDMVIKHAEKLALEKIDEITDVYIDAETVVQDIITIGGRKIKTGDMQVDAKLLMSAIQEEGKRKKMGTLRELLEGMDKDKFNPRKIIEGEVIDEEGTS